jgi:hypothetical protein
VKGATKSVSKTHNKVVKKVIAPPKQTHQKKIETPKKKIEEAAPRT